MRAILGHCEDLPEQHMSGGTVLLAEGQSTGRVYVLVSGRIEVLRGDTQVTILDEPGSLVGEMSYLLGPRIPRPPGCSARPRCASPRMPKHFSAPIPSFRG